MKIKLNALKDIPINRIAVSPETQVKMRVYFHIMELECYYHDLGDTEMSCYYSDLRDRIAGEIEFDIGNNYFATVHKRAEKSGITLKVSPCE